MHRSGTCASDGVAAVKQRGVSRVGVEVPAFNFSFFSFHFFESWLHVPTTPLLLLLLPAALTLVPGEPERAQRPYSRCEYFFFLFFSFFHPSERVSLTPPGRLARHMSARSRRHTSPLCFFPAMKKKKKQSERMNEGSLTFLSHADT